MRPGKILRGRLRDGMTLLALLHPFARLGRGLYFLSMVGLIAIAATGLWVSRHGEIYSDFGKFMTYPALWCVLMAMINRSRDARASPGWVLLPVILSAAAVLAWLKVAGATVPQTDSVTGKTSVGEAVDWFIVMGSFLWFGTLAAAALWAISILGLALLPSRAAPQRNKLRIG